jgi:RimJ/RimL family protein N-acetyltransferase
MESLDRFTTTRLSAERLTLEHRFDMLRQDQDVAFMALIGGVRTEAQTAERMLGALRHWETHGCGVWMLRERQSGRVIGRAVVRHLDVNGVDELEIGYAFIEEFWGRGLATEIARACVDICRGALGRTSCVALIDPRNDASRHVLEKAGLSAAGKFTQEGVELDLFRGEWPEDSDGVPGAMW